MSDIDDDRDFFESNPYRSYRVRPATTVEAAALFTMNVVDAEPPAGQRWFAAIKQIEPGKRARALFLGPMENADYCDDMSEDEAEFLFNRSLR